MLVGVCRGRHGRIKLWVSLLVAGSWTGWPLRVPSKSNNPTILQLYDFIRFAEWFGVYLLLPEGLPLPSWTEAMPLPFWISFVHTCVPQAGWAWGILLSMQMFPAPVSAPCIWAEALLSFRSKCLSCASGVCRDGSCRCSPEHLACSLHSCSCECVEHCVCICLGGSLWNNTNVWSHSWT